MFVYVWEFHVAPEKLDEFIAHYGPRGSWTELFAEAPGYVGTELIQDRVNPLRFITIDTWASEAHRSAAQRMLETGYRELDARCSALTTLETHLGDFDLHAKS